MLKKFGIFCISIAVLFSISAFGQQKAKTNDSSAKRKLLGKHMLSLQWISWDYFGTANVSEKGGFVRLKGEQKGRENSDYIKIDGFVSEINSKSFKFDGTIEIQVSHNNDGEPCIRKGEMTFAITKNRKYWRLQEMDNPCEEIVDYVDIYFR